MPYNIMRLDNPYFLDSLRKGDLLGGLYVGSVRKNNMNQLHVWLAPMWHMEDFYEQFNYFTFEDEITGKQYDVKFNEMFGMFLGYEETELKRCSDDKGAIFVEIMSFKFGIVRILLDPEKLCLMKGQVF